MKAYKIMKLLLLLFSLLIFISACGQSNYELANSSYKAGDYERAFKEFSFLANDGDIKAQYFLGVMYEKGQYTEQNFQHAAKCSVLDEARC